ncbi:lysophospholipid acyltransferase family protein [Woodsholea maritima]|uniref:lysophospholipid acyltransferase family protein n=1 Tax=Woodsholea maritima TaxID=240237 RepID=UPI00038114EF|nr:lysophospholipid acyltransferase family protein [Woodsholea maritima]
MTGFLQHIGWRAEALAWDGYNTMFRAMGPEKASQFGADLFKVLGPKTPTDHIARVNMRVAFPDAHEREIDQLIVRMWDNFGRTAAEFPNMHRLDYSGKSDQVEIEGLDILHEISKSGEPAILVGGHFANWEVLGATISNHVATCRITYRHANNPIIDQRIIDQREAYGVRIFAPKGSDGAKEAMKALKLGNSVGIMNDQKMNDGIAVPFFGREAMTASGPSRLAMKYNAKLIPMNVRRLDGVRFKVTVYEPIALSTHPNKTQAIYETACKVTQIIERWIHEAPAQWFWVHRRFEKSLYRKTSG